MINIFISLLGKRIGRMEYGCDIPKVGMIADDSIEEDVWSNTA
jgi:hypothetical protein